MAIPGMRKGDYWLYQQSYYNDFQKQIFESVCLSLLRLILLFSNMN